MGLSRSIAASRAIRLRFAILTTVAPVAIGTAVGPPSHWVLALLGAVGACVAALVIALVVPKHGFAFGPLVCAMMVSLTAMQAGTGGVASPYAMLTATAMLWLGLRARSLELMAGLAMFAGCCFLPMVIAGPPAYPVLPVRATLLFAVGCAVAGSLRSVCREMDDLARRLQREAVIDDLTGLLNRRGWRRECARELTRAARSGDPVGLVAIDLDHFKALNDSWGHQEGDRVLRQTASRMRAAFRAGDVIARLGGDEFVALLTDSGVDGARRAISRLRRVTPPDGAFSVGVAIWDREEDLLELMKRADGALYAAKASGGNVTELAVAAGAQTRERWLLVSGGADV